MSLGVDFKLKNITVGAIPVKVQIWDTGGQERFRTITKNYYEKADGVVLAYDCTDDKSFEEIRNWMTQIENHARPQVPKLLVASKCDLKDIKVDSKEGQAIAAEFGMPFFETSAKVGTNVKTAFECIIHSILKQEVGLDEKTGLTVSRKTTKKKSACC